MDRLFGFGVFSARFRGLRLIALDYLARSPQNISFSFSRLDKKKTAAGFNQSTHKLVKSLDEVDEIFVRGHQTRVLGGFRVRN